MTVTGGWAADVSPEEKAACGVGYVPGKPIRLAQLKQIVGEALQFKQK